MLVEYVGQFNEKVVFLVVESELLFDLMGCEVDIVDDDVVFEEKELD